MKLKLGAVAALLSLASFLVIPIAAHAASTMRSGSVATVAKGEIVDASIYLAGPTVTVAGDVHGDVFCAGQNVDITGTVEGDVFCAGQTVQVSGSVSGSVHVAGQTVLVSGQVGHSLSLFGQSVTTTSGATVGQDVRIFASSLELGGRVARDAVIAGQNLTLDGTVGRDVTAVDRQLTVADSDHVGGNLDYTSASNVTLGSNTVISGQTTRHEPAAHQEKSDSWFQMAWGAAYWFGTTLVFGLLLLAFVPRSYDAAKKVMIQQSGWSLLAGVGTLILTPIVAILLMVTIIGLPAGITLMLLWVVSLIASFAYGTYGLGSWIADQAQWKLKWPKAMALFIGVFLLGLLMLVPFVGGFLSFLTMLWGLGGLTLATSMLLKSAKHSKKESKA